MKNLLVIAPRFPSINQPWIDTYLEELLRSGITLGICSSLKEPQPYQQKVDHLKLKDKIIPYNDQFSLMKILQIIKSEGIENEFKQVLSKSKELKNKIGDPNLELIAVLPNLKLPFKVHQTLPIQEFDASTLNVDKEKTYVMVCQKGFNSYKATEQLKEKYPSLQVFNLTGGIRNY